MRQFNQWSRLALLAGLFLVAGVGCKSDNDPVRESGGIAAGGTGGGATPNSSGISGGGTGGISGSQNTSENGGLGASTDGGQTGSNLDSGVGGQPGSGGTESTFVDAGTLATTYQNPVIPGFHPDPSIVRVGDDFYLVTSSFEYFPGVPIFHSRDLVHWRQIGHCLTRASQVSLASAKSSEGIFAPTIRYNNGTFYMVTTNIATGNFYVTTQDPAGEWSEPKIIRGDASTGGIDPSLFFDDDGKVYFTREGDGESGGIFQSEIDISTGRLAARPVEIWGGTGGVWPEGPHLYKINQTYYLMIAEGGTSYAHMETIAQSTSPNGPFTAYAGNPILTHKGRPGSPIQATGHADLVQLQDGAWWMVFLGVRPSDGTGHHHHLGRETFLAPVTWDASNWPHVNGDQPIEPEMSTVGLPPQQPAEVPSPRDDFSTSSLSFVWNFLRNPDTATWSLDEHTGFLRLNGTQVSLNEVGSPAFIGRRQEHFRAHVATSLDFATTSDGQEAGLTLRANEDYHYDLAVTQVDGERCIRLRTRIAGTETVVSESALPAGVVTLSIEAYQDHYEFFVTEPGTAAARSLGTAPTTPLSSEVAGGFTGAYIGMYAWDSSGTTVMPPADFDWFDYQPLDG